MSTLHMLTGLILALGVVTPNLDAQERAATTEQPRQIQVTILGMSCPFCAYGVEQKLKRLEGVEALEVDLKTGIATLSLAVGADIPNDLIMKTVKDAGFEVVKITRTFESKHPSFDKVPAR